MTQLRPMMLDEFQLRNYSPTTLRNCIHAIEDFARYFGRSPYRLGPEHIRQYQVHLFRERKLSAGMGKGRTATLRFLLVKSLKRPYRSGPFQRNVLSTVRHERDKASNCEQQFGDCLHRFAQFERIFRHKTNT